MGPLRTLALVLSPRSLGLRNTVLRGNRRPLYAGLGVTGLLFWLGLFAAVYYLIDYAFDIVGPIAPLLAEKLLEMLLASLFVMLSFSNVITALSTFYLSDDLELVLSLPLRREEFHYARALDTLVQSSWMMGLFGVPVFLAYGSRAGAPPAFYLALFLAIPLLLTIATNLGITLATVLVNVFPARRTRELMVLLGLLMVVSLFILLRSLRPERLVDAQEFQNAAQYVAQLSVPAPPLFPPRWASDLLSRAVLMRSFSWSDPHFYTSLPWKEFGLLFTGALASSSIARWTTAWGFDTGWSRSQEAKAARFYRSPIFDRLTLLVPGAWRAVLGKELRVFARDPAQWSQVFLLFGICGIYLVSMGTLPLTAFQGPALVAVKQGMSFVNLGMAGFVMAAIAARFQFTAVSREGRSWWLVRAAPIEPATFLWAKTMLGIVPMLVVGLVVVVGSGLLLDAAPALLVLEAVTTLLLAFGISGIAVSMGAVWPDFKAENAARAATGPAAVFFMVVAQGLVFLVLALEVLGVWFFVNDHHGWALGIALVALGACIGSGWWPVRRSAERLWESGV